MLEVVLRSRTIVCVDVDHKNVFKCMGRSSWDDDDRLDFIDDIHRITAYPMDSPT